MSNYTPPAPPAERRRRSERAKQVQQAMQEKAHATASSAKQTPERQTPQPQPSRQSSAVKSSQPARAKKPDVPAKTNRQVEDWQPGVHPGSQGYKPQQPARTSSHASRTRTASQPRSVERTAPAVNVNTASHPVYQEQPWQVPQQPEYRPQGYGAYQQQGYAPGYGVSQNTQSSWRPDQLPPQGDPYGGQWQYPPQQGGGSQPPKKRSVLRNILLLLLCAGILAGAGVLFKQQQEVQQLNEYVASFNNVFCNGVYVDGIHLGGMTAEEGISAVQTQAQQRNDAWSVRLTYQGQLVRKITASDLNMSVDVMSVLNDAWQQGHIGTTDERKAAMDALATTPYEGYTAMPSSDTSVIDSILETIRNQVYRAPQDAQILTFDPEKTDPFTFQEEVHGRYLDTAPVKEQLYHMVSSMESGSIELTPESIVPTVTVADLKKTVTLRGTAYTKISTTSTEDRNKNIVRSCQLIAGTIIQPGEKFSFNTVVGQRTEANGFYPAVEYANGEHVEGVGGGVCQTSTTVYLAAVYAGMEIVKREPHSDAVGYTEYGKDATVYWQYGRKIDFVFKNTTDSPVYMVAKVQSDPKSKKRLICKVDIYGEDMGNVTYGLETQVVEELQPPETPEYVKDKNAQYVTYTDEEYVARKAAKGYVVDSYRVKYVDGNEVERTKMYTDTYKAKAQRIYQGVTVRPSE